MKCLLTGAVTRISGAQKRAGGVAGAKYSDTSVILRISGHKHIKMMKYYTHLEENFVNKEFDKIREKM